MSELTTKTIRVDSVADNGKKITLLQGKEKYGFWKNKQDGSETKAYEQFKSLRVEAGKEYPIAVKEEEKTFTNESGKEITFMERNLMYFATKEAGQGYVPDSSEKPVASEFDPLQADLQRRVAELELWRANMKPYLEKVVGELKSLRILVEEVAGKQATDLHTSLKNRDIRETKEIVKDAAAIVDSYKSDPTIPTINGVPEGFDN